MALVPENHRKYSPSNDPSNPSPQTLSEILSKTDRALFMSLDEGNVEEVEAQLIEFCYACGELLDEDIALHALELYYYSVPIHLIRKMIQAELHTMEDLANLSLLVSSVKKWKTIQEYISLTPWYASQLMSFTQGKTSLVHANPYVLEAISYIQKNLDKPELSTTSIANNIGISQGYLAALFKDETGYSIPGYMKKYRLKNAAVDLVNSHIPLKQIAHKHGFKSQSAFSKFFSEMYGMTPLQFRARGTLLPDYTD